MQDAGATFFVALENDDFHPRCDVSSELCVEDDAQSTHPGPLKHSNLVVMRSALWDTTSYTQEESSLLLTVTSLPRKINSTAMSALARRR